MSISRSARLTNSSNRSNTTVTHVCIKDDVPVWGTNEGISSLSNTCVLGWYPKVSWTHYTV